MQIFRKLADVPADFGPTIVSVGNFDGVHRAHQTVLRDIAERARQSGTRSVAVTFEPHPIRIADRLQAKRVFFTHICHDLPHAATNAALPPNVRLSYDGMKLEFEI